MQEIISETLEKIEAVSPQLIIQAQAYLDTLTKPKGSLGVLEEIASRYVAICGKEKCSLKNKSVIVFASDHGVAAEGVSAFPAEVTSQMVLNFLNQGAAVNVLANHINAQVTVVDIGVNFEFQAHPKLLHRKIASGTRNMATEASMTRAQAETAIATGIEIAAASAKNGIDILATGEMGIGNTSPSSAIFSILGNKSVEEVTGRGTGIDDDVLKKKISVISKALRLHQPDVDDPIDILAKVGGFDIGGITGLILGAAAYKIPIVVDGFISGAAAALALKLNPTVNDYLFTSHRSSEPGHQVFFDLLGRPPLFDYKMRLGEGTGALLAISLIESAVKIFNEMATFQTAAVSGKLHR